MSADIGFEAVAEHAKVTFPADAIARQMGLEVDLTARGVAWEKATDPNKGFAVTVTAWGREGVAAVRDHLRAQGLLSG